MRQRLVTLGSRPSDLLPTLTLFLLAFLLGALPVTAQEGEGERVISVGEDLIFASDVLIWVCNFSTREAPSYWIKSPTHATWSLKLTHFCQACI